MLKSGISDISSRARAARTMPFRIDENGRVRPGGPTIRFRTCKAWPGAKYYLALPEAVSETTPVLVSVHGISRNAREHAKIFAKQCNDFGCAVVAPLFTANDFPGYQRLGFGRKQTHPRSDLALNAILDEVSERTGAHTDRVYMFGYSGGGQFVHRYAMTNPHRVMAAALGAPGWFTFPNQGAPFPRGLRIDARQAGFELDWERALRVPTAVFVGQQDTDRDDTLNTGRKIDDQQGRTRPARGRRWIAAMRAAARFNGLDTWYEFCELKGCGHSFTECMTIGRLDIEALDFLICAGTSATNPPARRRGHCASWLSFLP